MICMVIILNLKMTVQSMIYSSDTGCLLYSSTIFLSYFLIFSCDPDFFYLHLLVTTVVKHYLAWVYPQTKQIKKTSVQRACCPSKTSFFPHDTPPHTNNVCCHDRLTWRLIYALWTKRELDGIKVSVGLGKNVKRSRTQTLSGNSPLDSCDGQRWCLLV